MATASGKLKSRESVAARAAAIQARMKFDIDLPEFASRYEASSEYEWHEAKFLTDDFAPVNLYQHEKSWAQ